MDNHARATKYSERGYTTISRREETTDGDIVFVAYHPEFAGLIAQGESHKAACANLDELRVEWIESMLNDNLPIPGPMVLSPGRTYLVNSHIPSLRVHETKYYRCPETDWYKELTRWT